MGYDPVPEASEQIIEQSIAETRDTEVLGNV